MKVLHTIFILVFLTISLAAQESFKPNPNTGKSTPQSADLAEADRIEQLAADRFSKRDYKQAIDLLGKALSLREKALGPNHPDVAATLHNLANAYEKAGKHELAQPLYLRAISILKSSIGQADPESVDLVRDYFCAGRNNSKDDKNVPDAETATLIKKSICSLAGFDDNCHFEDVLNGRASKLFAPPYPRGATATQQITVYVHVDETGRVITAKTLCGDLLLRRAAVEAAFQARFKPRIINGVPTPVNGVLFYDFVYQR